jgi:hypothetical protein
MEEAIIAHLLGAASLVALVGARIYPARRLQASELPGVVVTRVGGERHYDDAGPVDLVASRVQVDCWARSYGEAKRVARAVRDRLIDVKTTLSGVEFQATYLEEEQDLPEGGAGQSEYLHRTMLEFLVWHREATP